MAKATEVPKIKNVSGEDRIVPHLGGRLVLAGAVVEVPAEDVYAYTCQTPNWEPANAAAQDAHTAAEAALNPNPVEG